MNSGLRRLTPDDQPLSNETDELRPSRLAYDSYLADNAGIRPDYTIRDTSGRPIAARWRRPPARSRLPPLGQNVLVYHVGGSTSLSMFIDGKCIGTGSSHGTISFKPYDLAVESVRGGSVEMVHLYLDQAKLDDYVASSLLGSRRVSVSPMFAIKDPWMRGFFLMLIAEFEIYGGPESASPGLLVAQTEQCILKHLVDWYSSGKNRLTTTTRGTTGTHPLSSRRLQLVIDYIGEYLAADIKLSDLAELAGQSVNHFIRSFKAATQRTPYGYVLEARLSRASEAIRNSDQPLASIATDAGFHNASALANAFKRRHGVTPSQYRANSR